MDDVQRNSFTFFASFYTSMRDLPPNDKLTLYNAIVEYGLFGVMPDLRGVPRALFELMRPNIDSSNRRREAGRRGGLVGNGGAPVGNQNAVKFTCFTENKSKTIANQKQINSDIDKDKDKEEETEKEKESEKKEKNDSESLEGKGVSGERGERKPHVLDFPGSVEITVSDDKKINSLAYVKNAFGMFD